MSVEWGSVVRESGMGWSWRSARGKGDEGGLGTGSSEVSSFSSRDSRRFTDVVRIVVVYHHGKSAQGGHYTVAVRPAPSPSSAPIPSLPLPSSTSSTPATKPLVPSEWIHIDDTSIRSISESEVVSGPRESDGSEGDKGAYLLLYTRL
jgi:hypothetical protein